MSAGNNQHSWKRANPRKLASCFLYGWCHLLHWSSHLLRSYSGGFGMVLYVVLYVVVWCCMQSMVWCHLLHGGSHLNLAFPGIVVWCYIWWYGAVCNGMVYHTVVWSHLLYWPSLGQLSTLLLSRWVLCSIERHWFYGMVWHDLVWCGMVWHDMTWHGMV